MDTAVLLGVDIGTSDTKVLVTTSDGQEVTWVAAPTTWTTRGAYTETHPDSLVNSVLALIVRAVEQAHELLGAIHVDGIGLAGLGEAGVLLDEHRRPVHPVIAWFDPRGGHEFTLLDPDLLGQFRGRTGLPLSPLATIAKLAWMRGQGTNLAGHVWLSVPEFIAYRLTGTLAAEYSLAARTGLIDQDTSLVWPAALDALAADGSLLPPLVVAGTPLGAVSPRVNDLPQALTAAVVTVAGHDHPVAAVGSGAVGPNVAFDSFGTAQVLVRATAAPLEYAARERLALAGINSVHHVMKGRRILVAGTRSGLLLRRALNLLGVHEDSARQALDDAAMAATTPVEGVSVSGARNDDGALRILVDTDRASPTDLWLAALVHGTQEVHALLEVMAAEVGPFDTTVVAGGWTQMASVRRARVQSLPGVRFSSRRQAGAFGAAMFAAHAATAAQALATAGDRSANGVHQPSGPTDSFAAQFTHQL